MERLRIDSEIGTLKRVILHSPGLEVESMTPDEAEKDLYNDIIPLDSVLSEYTQLKSFLGSIAKMYELVDILKECLGDQGNKYEFLAGLSRCFPVGSAMERLMAMEAGDLANAVIRGIPSPRGSLASLVDPGSYLSRPLPNAYFMRDSAAVLGEFLISSAMAFDVRSVEAVITRFIFTHHPDFLAREVLFDGPSERNRYLTMEGGDIAVLSPGILAIGISERTTASAVEKLARNALRWAAGAAGGELCIFAVDLPKERATIHLDMVFTMIDRDAALVYEPVILGPGRSRVFRIEPGRNGKLKFYQEDSLLKGLRKKGLDLQPVLCGGRDPLSQKREQWLSGANSFAFGPGKIIMYSCNKGTAEALSAAGFEIRSAKDFMEGGLSAFGFKRLAVTFDGVELARGGGGARCMTLPVERESIA